MCVMHTRLFQNIPSISRLAKLCRWISIELIIVLRVANEKILIFNEVKTKGGKDTFGVYTEKEIFRFGIFELKNVF